MAIKGKKKSQQRGSQGVRRPAAAPRPVVTGRRHTPWYRTRDGMLVLGIFIAVGIGVVIWLIGSARENAKELEREQAVLTAYTNDVRAPLESVSEPVTEMAAVTSAPGGKDLDELAEDAEGWVTSLQEAQTALAQTFPSPPTDGVHQIFNEALGLYTSAAQTFALLPDVAGETRAEVFTRASTQRDLATAVFASAISVLDEFRSQKDLRASGLRPPADPAPAPGAVPTALPSIQVSPPPAGGGGGGSGNGDGGNGGGGGGDKGNDGSGG